MMAAVVMSSKFLSRRVALKTKIPTYHAILRYFVSPNENDAMPDLKISESCVGRLKELGENTSLRISVEGGGCSGFQYRFELDTPVEKGDKVFTKDGVSIIVDEESLNYVKGATIEYHKELIRAAFRIVNNPLADHGCSCGASFNIKVS